MDGGDDDDWGDFGGFQSATDESQAQDPMPTVSWAASFPAMQMPLDSEKPAQAAVQGNATSQLANFDVAVPFVAEASQETSIPQVHDSLTAAIPPVDAEMKTEIPVNVGAAALGNESTEQQEPVSEAGKIKDATIMKFNSDLQKIHQEKASVESKLAHTLLLLDEQKTLNQELQIKAQDELKKMEEQSKMTLTIVLEEHRRQTKEAILENQQHCLLDSKTALDNQVNETNKRLQVQKEEHDKSLEEERKKFAEETKELLQKLREEFESESATRLAAAQATWEEKTAEKLETNRLEMLEKYNLDVETEKENGRKVAEKLKADYESSLEDERQSCATKIAELLKQQRDEIWESAQSLLEEQRVEWKSLAKVLHEETLKNTMDYVKKKAEIDAITRRRQLSGVEILLANVQTQLKELTSTDDNISITEEQPNDEKASTANSQVND